MSFSILDWDILISSFNNIKLSFGNYLCLQALEMQVHKYEDIENGIKIKDKKMPPKNQNDNFSVAKCRIYLKPCC